MNRLNLIVRIASFFGDCVVLAEKKNKDYAKEDDALCNFRHGITGIISRLDEKIVRLGNVHNSDGTYFESLEDTLMDIANYAALAFVITVTDVSTVAEREGKDE